MDKRFFAIAATILAVAASSAAAIGLHTGTETASVQRKTVKTVSDVPTAFQPTAEFSGFIRGAKQSDIAPKASGYVAFLLKEEGESVASGETVAILTNSDISATQNSALASLEAMQKSYREIKRYYGQKVDEAEAALKKTRHDYDNGDSSRADVNVAEEALSSAKRLRDSQMAAAAVEKSSVTGSALSAYAQSDGLTVRASFAGVVTAKHATIGSFVTPGTALYTVASPNDLEIAVSVPGNTAANISKGSAVHILSDDNSRSTDGTVFSVAQAISETTQQSLVRVRFIDNDASAAFRLGEHATVRFATGASRMAILIPDRAIISAYDDNFVFTVQDGLVKKRIVTLGSGYDGQREILSGLDGSERVIVEGQYTQEDGQAITEIPYED